MHASHPARNTERPAGSESASWRNLRAAPGLATRLLIAVVLLALAGGSPLPGANSLSQFGITWTFDQDYPSGQFANGDYWVVGPVRVIDIKPGSETTGDRTINGSMLNPVVDTKQGYDSASYGQYGPGYDPSLNVGRGVSPAAPLTLPAGSSLISAISEEPAGNRPQLRSAAILTILAAPAPAGSFRPPYCGADKTLRWNKAQLDYSKLRSLPKPRPRRDLAEVEAYLERPWLEHNPDWTGRYLHPSENQPDYGRDMALQIGEALLSLQLDYSEAEKEKLLIRLVQYGIDIYGVAKAGGAWLDLGGHNQGRKMPLLLAATVLGDADMLAYGDAAKHFIFQEDLQTFYVAETDVGRELAAVSGEKREPYIAADIGMAEWGIRHASDPRFDGRNWDVPYRLVSCPCTLPHVLAARLMGLEKQWNWPALFDYYDRFWEVENASRAGGAGSINAFTRVMWSTYRAASGGPPGDGARPVR
ncbi:MAG TPA: hypothetical protein VGD81_13095 [Opitutaceae bacterium]